FAWSDNAREIKRFPTVPAAGSFGGAVTHPAEPGNPMQDARQLIDRVGLLHQLAIEVAVLGRCLAVASGQHDGHADAAIADRLREIEPGHAWHHDVRENDIETIR